MADNKSMQEKAWQIGIHRGPTLWVSAPGPKRYINTIFSNHKHSFVNISITGTACALNCAHCQGRLLETMHSAQSPEALRNLVDRLAETNCKGILISGGANIDGEVPLLKFADAIFYAREKGLKVLVHGGLISGVTARAMYQAGVDQVLMDVIGNEETIKEVYHLDRRPEDYLHSMRNCREEGLQIVPHLVVGLHFGQIKGEWRALEMIKDVDPQALVMVVISPKAGTLMERVFPPQVEEVASLIAQTRIEFTNIPVNLGCAKPIGKYKRELEALAVNCGIDTIAYADEDTIRHAQTRGLTVEFTEQCCSLAGIH